MHIIILIDGIAYYPGHEPGEEEEPGGGGREAFQLPEITQTVELKVDGEKFARDVQKLIDNAQKKG